MAAWLVANTLNNSNIPLACHSGQPVLKSDANVSCSEGEM